MSSVELGWEALLYSDAPAGSPLKAALFTTYDRAEERLLAEHLLPLLLKDLEPEGEGAERKHFLLKLDRRLKQLHDKLVVVSSTVREEPSETEGGDSGTYGWIWRSIRHLTVGSRRKAVQHAKLWLLHWGAEKENECEYLELVVSSANLTVPAFKSQLQAVWRACLPLRPQRSDARLDRWGVLPAFLLELAASCGDDMRLKPFVELLAHADCPEGASFVASVPGAHSRQVLRNTPWGAAGLRAIIPSGRGKVSVSLLSPFIGWWNAEALSLWCARFGGTPNRLELVWIDKNHPWTKMWMLPKITWKVLTKAGATLLHLRQTPGNKEKTDLFHEEHRLADDRWSHAKLYSFKRGTSSRLLLTSANFSPAAWGAENGEGELVIENFELGVCIEQADWPFDKLEAFEDAKDAATVSAPPSSGSTIITWAQAVWDGKTVAVGCRCEAGRKLLGNLGSDDKWTPISNWTVDADGRLHKAQQPWADAKHPPSLVRLTCEQETMDVPVFDARPSQQREDSVPTGVDENSVQTMRDELLFEQYGGRVADDVEDEQPTDKGDGTVGDGQEPEGLIAPATETGDAVGTSGTAEIIEGTAAGHPDSYEVPAFALARQHLGIVDNWAKQVKRAEKSGTSKFERQILRDDGELLLAAFKRQEARDNKNDPTRAIGAKLAAEELTLRLKHFPEA